MANVRNASMKAATPTATQLAPTRKTVKTEACSSKNGVHRNHSIFWFETDCPLPAVADSSPWSDRSIITGTSPEVSVSSAGSTSSFAMIHCRSRKNCANLTSLTEKKLVRMPQNNRNYYVPRKLLVPTKTIVCGIKQSRKLKARPK